MKKEKENFLAFLFGIIDKNDTLKKSLKKYKNLEHTFKVSKLLISRGLRKKR